MGMDRRRFVKIAGMAAVGLASGAPTKLIGQAEETPGERRPPLVGKRWAMVIDLRKCRKAEGCVDCINACHSAHNVPKFDNPKDEVKWVWKEPFEHAFEEQYYQYSDETVTGSLALLMCNHCNNPPCVRVCPTQATWKRSSDGIVMMDWHRCIGCRYCIAACPYGSRSFNWRDPRPNIEEITENFPTRMRGVVEKCTFCEERLAQGQMPLCVEACKEKALVFGDLEDPESEVRAVLGREFATRRKPELGTQPEVYYLV